MNIVWATDGSNPAAACVPYLRAIDDDDHRVIVTAVGPQSLLSDARPDPARLLWHIVPTYRDEVASNLTELVVAETKRLDTLRAEVTSAARLGSPAVEIIDVTLDEHADLLVVGAHGHSAARRLLLGSVAHQLTTHAPCSVLVVRHRRRPRRILLGVDGSPESAQALELVRQFTPRPGDVVVVAHALQEPPPLQHLEADDREDQALQHLYARAIAGERRVARRRVDVIARDLARRGWETEASIRLGTPTGLLLQLQEEREIDLIAIGAHGERVGDEPVSADAMHILRHAMCSVLIAREAGSTTPRSRRAGQ